MSTPTKPARRSQEERRNAMRERLAAAAFECVAQGGLNSLTMRNVAQTAGVSQGALVHHFPDKNSLILAAIEQSLELARLDSAAWLEAAVAGPEGVLRAMLAEFRAFFLSDRFWVAIGITLEANKDPVLNPKVRECVFGLRSPIYTAWNERLVAAGWNVEAAQRAVRSAAALVSGSAIRRLWAEADEITSGIEDEWIRDRMAALG